MRLTSLLTDMVKSDFVALTTDAEGRLKGGFGTIGGNVPVMPFADNNCLCSDNNCDCPIRPQTRPTNNCNCPYSSGDYTPKSGGNNCECKTGTSTDNCSCATTPPKNNGVFPALF